MAGRIFKDHKKSSQKNRRNREQSHLLKQQEPHILSEHFDKLVEDKSIIKDTPFQPPIKNHIALLRATDNSNHQAKIITQLQQTYGNRYVQHLLKSDMVQTMHNVNASGDVYEKGSDQIIDKMIDTDTIKISFKKEELQPKHQANVIIQRAQTPLAVHERNDFKDVENLVTSGGLNKAFGLTFPMVVSQINPELHGEIWLFVGLMEGQKDVDEEATTLENWEAKIKGLASMGLKGEWYTKEAVRAHENVHVASFLDITNEKEKTIRKKGQNALWHWRYICNKAGVKDHMGGATDNAELPIIKEKIENVWEEAFALGAESEQAEYTIKSQYQKFRKWPIIGKKQNKILANVKLNPVGTVSF